jgi:hypothetical protein
MLRGYIVKEGPTKTRSSKTLIGSRTLGVLEHS